MAENPKEELAANTTDSLSQNPSDETPVLKNIDNTCQNQQTENMEVHHHPDLHHKSKPWKEYLLEGLMIFIAVTMGFIAENIREYLVNTEIEKRNIESFIINVQKDSASLLRTINQEQNKIELVDSLSKISGNFTDISFQKQFFYYALKLVYYDDYLPDESAFLQMQSSGTLRLIKHQNITDSILKYQSQNQSIKLQQSYLNKSFGSAWDILIQNTDFRPLVFQTAAALVPQTPLKFNGNNQQMQSYISYKIVESLQAENYLHFIKTQLLYLTNLIPFLKREYDIK